jgi:hypothetical protein
MKFPSVEGSGGSSSGGKLFVKLQKGGSVRGVFRGDPKVGRIHWPKGERSSPCPGGDCPKCASGDKSLFRFKINLITKDEGIWVAKIFENNYGVYQTLKELHEGGYNLEQTLVMISKSGEGKNTRYNVLPVANNGGLTAKDFANIAKIPLNELSAKEPVAEAAETQEDDLPF